MPAVQGLDLVGDELGLVVLRVAGEADDRVARADVGPELLVLAVEVVADDGVRGGEDVLRRAVVLLEQHDLGARVVALELGDVADVGAAEGVDRLVGVADDGERGGSSVGASKIIMPPSCACPSRRGAGELVDERVLGVVGVLVLVDEDVPEPLAVDVGDVRERPEQVDGLADQVVEVEGVRALQRPLVVGEDLGEQALGGSLMFAVRANDSASANSFLSFEMRPCTDAGVNPNASASCSLTRRLMSARESPES
jgi:hypothetical protein